MVSALLRCCAAAAAVVGVVASAVCERCQMTTASMIRSQLRPPSSVDYAQDPGPSEGSAPIPASTTLHTSSSPLPSSGVPSSSSPSAAALLSTFVSTALSSLLSGGDRRGYETLLAQLSASVRSGDAAACGRWVAALSSSGSRLSSPQLSGLVRLLLSVPLSSLPLTALRPYTDLLLDLATHSAAAQQSAVVAVFTQLCSPFQLSTEAQPTAAAAAAASDSQRAAHAAIHQSTTIPHLARLHFASAELSGADWCCIPVCVVLLCVGEAVAVVTLECVGAVGCVGGSFPIVSTVD